MHWHSIPAEHTKAPMLPFEKHMAVSLWCAKKARKGAKKARKDVGRVCTIAVLNQVQPAIRTAA